MTDKSNIFEDVYLYPGEVCISKKPIRLITLLGSCVSLTFFSRQQRIGAILHALLPAYHGDDISRGKTENLKYLDLAFYYILEKLDNRYGVKRSELEIKLFGGASVFYFGGSPEQQARSLKEGIGRKNIDKARSLLEKENLEIRSEDTGGIYGRKLHFYPITGDVYVKRIKTTTDDIKYPLPTSKPHSHR